MMPRPIRMLTRMVISSPSSDDAAGHRDPDPGRVAGLVIGHQDGVRDRHAAVVLILQQRPGQLLPSGLAHRQSGRGCARRDGLLDAGEILLPGPGVGQRGVVGGLVGRAEEVVRVAALACLAAAMLVNASRSCAVIRLPASIPASSASSWESCSRAWMMAISPVAWPSWPLSDSLLASTRNRFCWSAIPWL